MYVWYWSIGRTWLNRPNNHCCLPIVTFMLFTQIYVIYCSFSWTPLPSARFTCVRSDRPWGGCHHSTWNWGLRTCLSFFGCWNQGKMKNTLQGTNISHLEKRKIIFKMPLLGDMLVPWRVIITVRRWDSLYIWGRFLLIFACMNLAVWLLTYGKSTRLLQKYVWP